MGRGACTQAHFHGLGIGGLERKPSEEVIRKIWLGTQACRSVHPVLHLPSLHLLFRQPSIRVFSLGIGPHDQESRLNDGLSGVDAEMKKEECFFCCIVYCALYFFNGDSCLPPRKTCPLGSPFSPHERFVARNSRPGVPTKSRRPYPFWVILIDYHLAY